MSRDLPARHGVADIVSFITRVLDVNVDHQYATMDASFIYPVVVQSHSSLIESVTCLGNDRIRVGFRSTKAANYAKEHWSAYSDAEPFVLVAHSKGCNAVVDGQNTFFKIKSMKHHKRAFGGADFELAVEQMQLEESVGEVDLTWGHHEVRDCSDGKCDDGGDAHGKDDKHDDNKHGEDKKPDNDKKHGDDKKSGNDKKKGDDKKPDDHKGKPDDCKDG